MCHGVALAGIGQRHGAGLEHTVPLFLPKQDAPTAGSDEAASLLALTVGDPPLSMSPVRRRYDFDEIGLFERYRGQGGREIILGIHLHPEMDPGYSFLPVVTPALARRIVRRGGDDTLGRQLRK